jgi:ribosomal protein S18 acetylase RimI-like enzyme
MYTTMGFNKIGIRKNYYKTLDGREDAITYKLEL